MVDKYVTLVMIHMTLLSFLFCCVEIRLHPSATDYEDDFNKWILITSAFITFINYFHVCFGESLGSSDHDQLHFNIKIKSGKNKVKQYSSNFFYKVLMFVL